MAFRYLSTPKKDQIKINREVRVVLKTETVII